MLLAPFLWKKTKKTVDLFLQNHPEFEIVSVKETVKNHTCDGIFLDGCQCENIHYARRFYPHKSKGEGQFMAVLHNKSQTEFINKKSVVSQKIDKTVFEFSDDVLLDYKMENVRLYNGNPVYFTPDLEVKDGVAFSCGITIGEVRKNYLLPHHQFFMG